MVEENFINYYEILQCNKNATLEELKKNYQRLALEMHPDKKKGDNSKHFQLIHEAWCVLRESDSRKQYDAKLACNEHSDILLYDTISLDDMEFIPDEGYVYNCRCGGTYLLKSYDSSLTKITISCDECSFSIEINL